MIHKDKIQVAEKEALLLSLADDMASAAASFNSHGYQLFVEARETFKETLHKELVARFLHDHT
jgi:hypothetical protein